MKPPLLVTGAIIINLDKVLLVKRAREPFKGYWSLIGGVGAFEETSDPQEAIKMEVYGDIKCVFNPQFFKYKAETYSEFDLRTVVLYFYGNIKSSPLINQEYVLEYKWVPLPEAVKMKLGFDHQDILNEFLKSGLKS